MMAIERITTHPDGYAPFRISQGTRVGNLIFISGQAGYGADGKIVAGDFLAQGRQAFRNLSRALEAGGAGLGDVAKVTIFVTNIGDHFQDIVTLRGEFFSEPWPADSIVEVNALYTPTAAIEIEAIAVASARS